MKEKFKPERITVRFPKELRDSMLQAIVDDGYGFRGKSKWAIEAIQRFLSLENFVEFVDIGSEAGDGELKETETFHLPRHIVDDLDAAVLIVKKEHPYLEGVRSIIIRASILQRLFRGTV
ncbi:MAG: hypothetical protein A2X78_01455 [Gammaproteobacteria bacterium GWE2_37_16]|nr:MAG: hypothetical protein A2X78_01455 [Gammaproteobacteria bacterium GWE2_37_16]